MGKFIDLTDVHQIDGRLTAIRRVENYITPCNGKPQHRWLCKCDCGNEIVVYGKNFTHGKTKSCGCIKKEFLSKMQKNNKKQNTYDLSGEFGIGYTEKGEDFYFDLEKYEQIKDYCWRIDRGYVITSIDGNIVYFHHMVLPCVDNLEVDHIDGNRNDNRIEKLRYLTHQENLINKSYYSKNTSGVIGVSWDKSRSKWHVSCTIDGKAHNIGRYDNFEEAVYHRVRFEWENIRRDIAPNRCYFEEFGFE